MEYLAWNKIPKGPELWKVQVRQACLIKLYSLKQLFWRQQAPTSIVIFTSCPTREKPKLENQPIKAASWPALLMERHDLYCNGSWLLDKGSSSCILMRGCKFESHYKSWLKSSVVEPEPEPQKPQLLPCENFSVMNSCSESGSNKKWTTKI